MTRRIALLLSSLAMVALLAACKPTEKTSEATKPAVRHGTARPASAGARTPSAKAPLSGAKTAPGKNVDVCQKIITEYQAIVKAARSNACKADSECVCYQGGYGDCGGVIDKVSNKKLLTLMHLARLSKCRYDRACAARSCIPACVGGRCVHSARVQR